jgi:two-component system sensor histidine kinase KdpD
LTSTSSPPQRQATTSPPGPGSRRRYLGWLLATAGIILLALGLEPLRSSLGLPGALLFLLVGVISVALIGGATPAIAAAMVATLAADYFFTLPYHSFRMTDATQIVDVVVFFVVAAAVIVLVHRLALRGLQVTRAQTEAEALAGLAGESILSGAEALPGLVTELRRTFNLDNVAILVPANGAWQAVASAGTPTPSRPQDAQFSAELDQGAVLVLTGDALSADDTRLLNAFVSQLRQAQLRTRLEAEAAAAAELAEANTLRNALLAAVSHDLRTPLAAIKAAATSLLSDEVDWPADQTTGFAKTIDAEADRLTHLVSNLLDMSRLQTGSLGLTLGPTDIEDLLYRTVESLGSEANGVVIDITEALPTVAADPGLLERALANVMDNALAWSPPGMAVRVEAGTAGDEVHVRVIDHGPGIPPDLRETVFEPFQRLGDGAGGSPHGVGLGLAVARGFVTASGGRLEIEDTPGGGATLVFQLRQA